MGGCRVQGAGCWVPPAPQHPAGHEAAAAAIPPQTQQLYRIHTKPPPTPPQRAPRNSPIHQEIIKKEADLPHRSYQKPTKLAVSSPRPHSGLRAPSFPNFPGAATARRSPPGYPPVPPGTPGSPGPCCRAVSGLRTGTGTDREGSPPTSGAGSEQGPGAAAAQPAAGEAPPSRGRCCPRPPWC